MNSQPITCIGCSAGCHTRSTLVPPSMPPQPMSLLLVSVCIYGIPFVALVSSIVASSTLALDHGTTLLVCLMSTLLAAFLVIAFGRMIENLVTITVVDKLRLIKE